MLEKGTLGAYLFCYLFGTCSARQQSYGMPIQEKPNNSFPFIQVQNIVSCK